MAHVSQGPMSMFKKRWINTRIEYCWNGNEYVEQLCEGYWHQGPMSLAHTSPSIDQDSYRWRDDDGSETAATWHQLVNTTHDFDVSSSNVQARLRFLIQEQNGASQNNFQSQLEYQINGGGYVNIGSATTGAIFYASANLTDDGDTTQQLGVGTFISPNEGQCEDGLAGGGAAGEIDFVGSDEAEIEFTVELVAADLSDTDSLDFRIAGVDVFTNTANCTITKVVGGQDIVVGQATETNIAQVIAVAGLLTLGVSQSSEADIAQIIKILNSVPTVQSVETDISQPILVLPGIVTISADQITETDTAQVVTPNQATNVSVGQIIETDTAQSITPISGAFVNNCGQIVESDIAQIVTVTASVSVGIAQVIETDLSQTTNLIPGAVIVAVGQVTESNTSQTISVIDAGSTPTFWIPDSRWELWELMEGRKPTEPVEIDKAHPLAPDLLAVVFNDQRVGDLVGKSSLNYTSPIPVSVIEGEMLADSSDGLSHFITLNKAILITPEDAFTFVFRCQNTNTTTNTGGMVAGDATTNSFVWLAETSFIRIRNNDGTQTDYSPFSVFNTQLENYAISCDGAGSASETLRFYQGLTQSADITGSTVDLTIDRIVHGYSDDDFSFEGYFSYLYIYGRRLSTDEIQAIHRRPYQFLIPPG